MLETYIIPLRYILVEFTTWIRNFQSLLYLVKASGNSYRVKNVTWAVELCACVHTKFRAGDLILRMGSSSFMKAFTLWTWPWAKILMQLQGQIRSRFWRSDSEIKIKITKVKLGGWRWPKVRMQNDIMPCI